jgi:hypothetical protein
MSKIRLINIPHLFVFLSVTAVSKLVEFRHSFSVFVSISMELYVCLCNSDLLVWNTRRITDLRIDGSTLIKCTSKKRDVKCSIYTARRHTGEAEVRFHSFLTSVLHGGEWLASLKGHFASEKITLYPLKKRLAGAENRSERFGKGKSLLHVSRFEPPTV